MVEVEGVTCVNRTRCWVHTWSMNQEKAEMKTGQVFFWEHWFVRPPEMTSLGVTSLVRLECYSLEEWVARHWERRKRKLSYALLYLKEKSSKVIHACDLHLPSSQPLLTHSREPLSSLSLWRCFLTHQWPSHHQICWPIFSLHSFTLSAAFERADCPP